MLRIYTYGVHDRVSAVVLSKGFSLIELKYDFAECKFTRAKRYTYGETTARQKHKTNIWIIMIICRTRPTATSITIRPPSCPRHVSHIRIFFLFYSSFTSSLAFVRHEWGQLVYLSARVLSPSTPDLPLNSARPSVRPSLARRRLYTVKISVSCSF